MNQRVGKTQRVNPEGKGAPDWIVIAAPGKKKVLEELLRAAGIKSMDTRTAAVAAASPGRGKGVKKSDVSSKPYMVEWTEEGRECKLMPELGVAAVQLSDGQRGTLRADDSVRIVPNEPRYIQGMLRRIPGDGQPEASSAAPLPAARVSPRTFARVSPRTFARVSPRTFARVSPRTFAHASGPPLPDDLRVHLEYQRELLNLLLGDGPPPGGGGFDGGGGGGAGGFGGGGGNSGLSWALEAIGITPGYNLTGKGVRVAVLDTGLASHPDIEAIPPERRWNFIADTDDVTDGNGHGTHCCGVVAGSASSISGTRYGVAPDVELLVGKVMGDDGIGYDSDILAGIAWAVYNKAQIISLSLGSPRGQGGAASAVYEQLAQDLETGGGKCLLIAAAGNDSQRSEGLVAPVSNPAACNSFLGVAAIDRDFMVADFSNGQTDGVGVVDLCAPGVDIVSAYLENDVRPMDGTSMAAPHVAGAAALYLQQNPDLTPRALWDLLERKARPALHGSSLDYGRGCVQVP